MNERAWALADLMDEEADALRVRVHHLPGGARVIDAGIEVPGGLSAGLMMSELCLGDLGDVSVTTLHLGGRNWPGLLVRTDFPAVACMASQYAGWAINPPNYFAMGSGPLRAHARVEKELFAKLGYSEQADRGVLILEGRTLPTDAVAEWVCKKAGLTASQITFVIAPTASLAGLTQISARVVETGLHKMETLGFDLTKIISGMGTAPLSPVARNDGRGIGRTNDCILYGGQVHYTVDASDDELAALAPRVPASASRDYGRPFYEIFERNGKDFYKIDPLLFSPAEIRLTSITSGKTFSAGEVNAAVLEESLYGSSK
ncbi:MAG: methenyltetrahydromethanopterin cyclohydrolase [Gemmatimonadota bacterium]